jgi:hypothetical protein
MSNQSTVAKTHSLKPRCTGFNRLGYEMEMFAMEWITCATIGIKNYRAPRARAASRTGVSQPLIEERPVTISITSWMSSVSFSTAVCWTRSYS